MTASTLPIPTPLAVRFDVHSGAGSGVVIEAHIGEARVIASHTRSNPTEYAYHAELLDDVADAMDATPTEVK